MAIERVIGLLALGAIIPRVVEEVFKMVTKRDEKKNARNVVAGHMRRVGQQIDGLDTYVRFGMRPGLEHVKMVRRVLSERETLNQHMENMGDSGLEREVRDWFQITENALQFAEDYVSDDPEAPKRYGVDRAEWDRRWSNQYALHANQIIAMDRIANRLEGKKQRSKKRKGADPTHARILG